MPSVTVIVKPNHGRRAGWKVHHFRWDGPTAPPPDIEPVRFNEDDGTFSGSIEVGSNMVHCIAVHVTIGTEVEVDIDPRWKITQPAGETWPLEVAIAGTRTQRLKTIYFREGTKQ